MKLNKKQRVLITGANGGIGNSISKKFLEKNYELILFFNKNNEQINLLKNNTRISTFQVDLLNLKNLDSCLKKVSEIGNIDIFIHSVSLPICHSSFFDLEWKQVEKNFNLQTRSFFKILKSITPSMKKNNHGKIITILTSYVVGTPPKNLTSYIVSKQSLLGLTKSLAIEFGQYGITVNSISPSLVETPLTNNLPNKLKEITSKQNPMHRLATTNDIASTVLFLASDDSSFINGENILITGGSNIK